MSRNRHSSVAVAVSVLAAGWTLTVFTTEAGLGGVGSTESGTFSPAKLVPIALMVCGVLALTGARRSVRQLSSTAILITGYLFWQLVCTLFSDQPILSIARVAQSAIPFAVTLIAVRRRVNPMWLTTGTLVACTAHVFLGFSGGKYVGFKGSQRLVGLLIANSFALAAAIVLVIAVGLWQSKVLPWPLRWVPLPLVGAGAYAIYQSVGRTASIAVPIAIFVGCVLFGGTPTRTVRAGNKRWALLLILLIGAVFATRQLGDLTSWFSTGNRSLSTLTGRTDVWDRVIILASDSPFVGYGPGAMRFGSERLNEVLGQYVLLGQAHNSLFEALLNSGVPGAVLWLAVMFSLLRQARQMIGQYRALAMSMAIMLLIFSITLANMSGFGIGWYALMATFMLVASDDPQPDAIAETRLIPGTDLRRSNYVPYPIVHRT